MKEHSMISSLLSERNSFILIGLTGRTGSGCTTTANLLSGEKFKFPQESEVNYQKRSYFEGLDKKRYEIIRNYADKNETNFKIIKISELISAKLLSLSEPEIIEFIESVVDADFVSKVVSVVKNSVFSKSHSSFKKFKRENDYFIYGQSSVGIDFSDFRYKEWLAVVHEFTVSFKKDLQNQLGNSYVKIYQSAGDSLRRTSKIIPSVKAMEFDPTGLHLLPRMANRLIKYHRQIDKKNNRPTFLVIDTIRNPHEAKYFKDRYAAFNLVSINAPTNDRKKYLQDKYKFSLNQIKELDKRESGKLPNKNEIVEKCSNCNHDLPVNMLNSQYDELITSNVKRCIEISDIHIFNPRNEPENHNVLKAQLAWYIGLMRHPGLVSPTSLERVMQIAFTAKMNSGCISRQVGAVVTDKNYSIKSVGWNDVAKGQIPCGLRSLGGLNSFSNDTYYSEYERNNEGFRNEARKQYIKLKDVEESGRNLSYCFKSIQNKVEGEKNQVHTRSLHAEENAFLQLAKYGSAAIEGGKLFTTASPCELCAKKAYQLGIKEIVFIDPYPGIAIEHIISIGEKPPQLVQFRGAVGKAYHHLYEPIMPYKDELEIVSGS